MRATAFYIRHREAYPDSELTSIAQLGMLSHGVETRPYYWIDDIATMSLSPTVGIAGYIQDVHEGLRLLGRPIPENVDYPLELQPYLGRSFGVSTLGAVRSMTEPIFVKPQEHKKFTGFVWRNDASSRMWAVTIPDETPVFVSEVVEFVAEFRAFILGHDILDVRPYKGDWSKGPHRGIVEQAAKVHREAGAPVAYCCDWGVTSDGRTLLVERNEGYSCGSYGLRPPLYATFLAARWYEMAGGTE